MHRPSSAKAGGLGYESGGARDLNPMTWVWIRHSLDVISPLSTCNEDCFSYIPWMHAVNVTESGCFPYFCSVPEECESFPHRRGGLSLLTWIPRMALEITVSSVVNHKNHKVGANFKATGWGVAGEPEDSRTLQWKCLSSIIIPRDSFPLNGLLTQSVGIKEHLGSFEKRKCIKSRHYYKLCWLPIQFTSLNIWMDTLSKFTWWVISHLLIKKKCHLYNVSTPNLHNLQKC